MKLPVFAVRFGLVGIVATLLHIMVASLLFDHWGAHAGWANTIAFMVSNVFSYAINSWWTFQQSMAWPSWRRFLGISFLGLLLTFAIAQSIEMAGGHFYLGLLAVVCTVPALSYYLHKRYTFRR